MQKKSISRDVPLSEITLRRYENPSNLKERELIRKLCLSIGLLQPGDSRDVIVDILAVLLEENKNKNLLGSEDIRERVIGFRKKNNLDLKGVASSNVRRQLKRLRDLMLVEKVKNNYRITEFENLEHIFEHKIKKYYLDSIVSRVKEYFSALE